MKTPRKLPNMDRREFLAATGSGLLGASVPALAGATGLPTTAGEKASSASSRSAQGSGSSLRKIPIGVFDPVYDKLSLDEMLDRVSALGLEAMEIGTGGYPGTGHCPIDELLADAAKANSDAIPHEMILLDLYRALWALDSLTGQTTSDDILNLIFSTFCIGK